MRKQIRKGIGALFCLGLLLGTVSGCNVAMRGKTPEKKETTVTTRTGQKAVLRTAESYEEIVDLLKSVRKESEREWDFYVWPETDGVMAVEESIAPSAAADTVLSKNEGMNSATSGAGTEAEYSKTNVQVEGIDEADIVKTDGKYLYIFNPVKNEVAIVSAAGEKFSVVSKIQVTDAKKGDGREMYLVGDRLVVVTSFWEDSQKENTENDWNYYYRGKNKVGLLTYDISDKAAPKLLSALDQDGRYLSSRCVGGYVYLFSDYYSGNYAIWADYDVIMPKGVSVSAAAEDEKKEETAENLACCLLPEINGTLIAPDCIYISDEPNAEEFVVLTALNLNAPEQFCDIKSVLSGGEHCYVSNDYIYIGNYVGNWRGREKERLCDCTEMYRFAYKDGTITPGGQMTVKGRINDQFSIDEYEGNLRLVTTVNEYVYSMEEVLKDVDDNNEDGVVDEQDLYYGDFGYLIWDRFYSTKQSNSLYIYDSNLELIGSIETLAPEEHIESARLMGKTGYFVTFRQTDPLFSVDLSDPHAPKVLGKLKIPGFSEYLHPFGENLLLGIGYDADETTGWRQGVKLSMFDISDPENVVEVHKVIFDEYSSTAASKSHKCVLVDAEKNLIGFPVSGYGGANGNKYKNFYCVFGYDAEKGFYEKMSDGYVQNQNSIGMNYKWNSSDYSIFNGILYNECRGIYIGDWFYLIQPCYEVRAYDMTGWKKQGNVILENAISERMAELALIAELNPEPLTIEIKVDETEELMDVEIVGEAVVWKERLSLDVRKGKDGLWKGYTEHLEFSVNAKGSAKVKMLFVDRETWEKSREVVYEVTVGDDYQIRVDSITELREDGRE